MSTTPSPSNSTVTQLNWPVLLLGLVCLACGCSRPIVLTHDENYSWNLAQSVQDQGAPGLRLVLLQQPIPQPSQYHEITPEQIAQENLLILLQNALSRDPRVTTLCLEESFAQLPVFDYLLRVESIAVRMEGSATNYPVTFPGCVVWACLWLGYRTHLEIITRISIYDRSEHELETLVLTTPYTFTHCDQDRSVISLFPGVGWVLAPFFGVAYCWPDEELISSTLLVTLEKAYGQHLANILLHHLQEFSAHALDR